MNMSEIEVISHNFIAGVYAKQMVIPDGYHVLTHKHCFDHMSILAQGCAIVECDGVQEVYYAPAVIDIKAHVEHEIIAVNGDCVWFCIHHVAKEDYDESTIDEVLVEPV
jgi:hypothetical protein